VTYEVFLVPWLLTDEHDAGVDVPFPQDGLRGAPEELACGTGLNASSEFVEIGLRAQLGLLRIASRRWSINAARGSSSVLPGGVWGTWGCGWVGAEARAFS
jgi:hypothetical protein